MKQTIVTRSMMESILLGELEPGICLRVQCTRPRTSSQPAGFPFCRRPRSFTVEAGTTTPRLQGGTSMWSIHDAGARLCDGLTRREWLRIGGLGAFGLSLPALLGS